MNKKRLTAIFTVLCLMITLLPASAAFASNTNEYNSTSSTYVEHTPATYVVGSGYESGDGYTCYEGDSLRIFDQSGKEDADRIILYKGDVIDFRPEMPAPGSIKTTHGLFKGFQLTINNKDVTSEYAEVISSYSAPKGTIYQKIMITSDKPFYLHYKGAGPTGEETYTASAAGNSDILYSNRFFNYDICVYDPAFTSVTYDYDGGKYYGAAVPPDVIYPTVTGYSFELPIPVKSGYKFVRWENITATESINPALIDVNICNVKATGTPYYSGPNTKLAPSITLKAIYEVDKNAADNSKLAAGVKATRITSLKAKSTSGKVVLTYTKSAGYKLDGYYIYKSTKKSSGFKYLGKTVKLKYTTSKSLVKGKTYYYKVKGYRVIDGKKVFTKTRTVAVVAK